ncbi:accessory factor UbiK family protein [Castellaniella daejeonensis]|uniref:Ubiquinone biosynthesis accessory factor UbiK n=1 Tax=Castellaniella daejeonensis TaxID=659013 RepID=A0ABN0TRI9_9BURK
MIAPNQLFDDFQKNMSELLAKTPAADIERNMKAFMAQAFARMDLVTREEFDIQADLLARALERIESLEARVQALEQGGE